MKHTYKTMSEDDKLLYINNRVVLTRQQLKAHTNIHPQIQEAFNKQCNEKLNGKKEYKIDGNILQQKKDKYNSKYKCPFCNYYAVYIAKRTNSYYCMRCNKKGELD